MDIQELKGLPIIRQIEIMQYLVSGAAFGALTYVVSENLDDALDAAHRDAIDQAAAENDALHGKEVSQLTDMWVSPCGRRVGG